MTAKSKGAYMRWWVARQNAFLRRCQGGQAKHYRTGQTLLAFVVVANQYEFDF
jgi:hypothetical protein